ncbi:MAG: hypothetical protein JRI25_24870, partial [Deltaproteobacteria bacterium]|nr:hypothetical protein [Deltaproteobacteria bacterium]
MSREFRTCHRSLQWGHQYFPSNARLINRHIGGSVLDCTARDHQHHNPIKYNLNHCRDHDNGPPATEAAVVVVTFDGSLHPSSITFEPGQSGIVEFRNETEDDWELIARGDAFPTLPFPAGGTATFEFATLERDIYRFWAMRGGVRSPGTVDNRGIVYSAQDLQQVTSWDGRLSVGVLIEATVDWGFEDAADGVIGGPMAQGVTGDPTTELRGFLAATVYGEELQGAGLAIVLDEPDDAGDPQAAKEEGEASLDNDLVPPNCALGERATAEHSGLSGAEDRYSCEGDTELIRGYLVAPGTPMLLVYFDAAMSNEEDRFLVDQALGNLTVDAAGGIDRTEAMFADDLRWLLGRRLGEALFDDEATAVITLNDCLASPPEARLGPWNSGQIRFHNNSDIPCRIAWLRDELPGGEIQPNGDLTVTVPEPTESRYFYTVSSGRTGRTPGSLNTSALSADRVPVDSGDDQIRISVPPSGGWWFWGFRNSINGERDSLGGDAVTEAGMRLELISTDDPLDQAGIQFVADATLDRFVLDRPPECESTGRTEVTYGGLFGFAEVLACSVAPEEHGVVVLFESGSSQYGFAVVVAYSINNDEDRFLVQTALE